MISIRFPWHSLIFSGIKTIENRNQALRDGLYAVYCPVKNDWKDATSHPQINKDIQSLQLQITDNAPFTGFIIGLIDMQMIKETTNNSCYWNDNFNYHFHIKRVYLAPPENYVEYHGHQGTKSVQASDPLFLTLQEWEKHLN